LEIEQTKVEEFAESMFTTGNLFTNLVLANARMYEEVSQQKKEETVNNGDYYAYSWPYDTDGGYGDERSDVNHFAQFYYTQEFNTEASFLAES
ncbi:MAG: hypothetical protein ABEI86_14010, partial [Halobacteriaceae archaeon]